MYKMYGIPNCDTVRKARQFMNKQNVDVPFHDIRKDGIDAEDVVLWCQQLGRDKVLNKRSTAWRELSGSEQQANDDVAVANLISRYPTLLKRPLLTQNGVAIVNGFNEKQWLSLVGDR